jgi:AcrR family transcriptional regulator
MSKKSSILKAALSLFAEKGFKDTPMTQLSKVTGAAEGTIFYHFKSKEGIFLAILENVRKEITAEFEQYFREKPFDSGLHMMEGVISFYLYLAVKMEDSFLLLQRHYPYQLAEKNKTCREHLEAIYNCLVDLFERAILRGQEDGSIRSMPARKTAILIFTMVDGLIRFGNNNLYDAPALYGDLIDSCKRMLQCDKQESGSDKDAE